MKPVRNTGSEMKMLNSVDYRVMHHGAPDHERGLGEGFEEGYHMRTLPPPRTLMIELNDRRAVGGRSLWTEQARQARQAA